MHLTVVWNNGKNAGSAVLRNGNQELHIMTVQHHIMLYFNCQMFLTASLLFSFYSHTKNSIKKHCVAETSISIWKIWQRSLSWQKEYSSWPKASSLVVSISHFWSSTVIAVAPPQHQLWQLKILMQSITARKGYLALLTWEWSYGVHSS